MTIGRADPRNPPPCAPPRETVTPPRLVVPRGSVDCHAHVFGPAARYPYALPRSYTPPDALLPAYLSVLAVLGIDRGVIVHPSVYGTNNRITLDALAEAGPAFRGTATIDPGEVTDAELVEMNRLGIRGARINAIHAGGGTLEAIAATARRIAPFGWHLQIFADVRRFDDLPELVAGLATEVVFDHMGGVPTSAGLGDPGFMGLLRALEAGRAWVKLSGAYRLTGECLAPYDDVAPFARALIAANPERCLWATDWPHPAVEIDMPDDGALLDMLLDWCPDEATRALILRDNPARLYGFPPVEA